jgi:hypothetical protein
MTPADDDPLPLADIPRLEAIRTEKPLHNIAGKVAA